MLVILRSCEVDEIKLSRKACICIESQSDECAGLKIEEPTLVFSWVCQRNRNCENRM